MTETLNDYDAVIGIDFGTTFSGYYVLDLNSEQNKNYYDSYFWRYKNMPSTMLYKKESEKKFTYGRSAEHNFRKHPDSGYHISKVKLWLDRTIKEGLPPLPPNMTPVKIIGDYLSRMHKDISKIPKKYPKFRDPSRYRYCMTVPTMWSEESKNIMREAAILAGIITKYDEPGKLLIIDEAVAAALYAEDQSPELNLTHGSLYMICDAGGGTVDLAVFEKDDSSGTSGLKEITMGTGSSCGSTFLDARFEALLREKVSKYPNYSEKDIQDALWEFSLVIKETFVGDQEEKSYCIKKLKRMYIQGHPDISDDETYSLDEIHKKVFDPVVDEVLGMIEKQFAQIGGRHLDVMFITGGFGQSPYLQARINDTFGSRVKHFKVIKDGNMAVMRGATLFGARPRAITQRILRRAYGIKLCSSNDMPEKNTPSVKDKFHVYIHKGEPVSEDGWITKHIAWKKDILPIVSLYAYDGDEPVPEYPSSQSIDLVAIFNTQFPIDDRKGVKYDILAMKMRFGLDKIDIKVNIRGRDFEYVTVWDVTGEKTTQYYSEPNPPPSVKVRKLWLMDAIVKYLP
ncbi:hypothetical protein PHYBLDRAFT_147671 [Phycomyces blakesleeanus NRRL 1555(-)]|uniref:Actin-like ATPase domain-containing protein n=2 Tax=Phycomyces blakesleeanus TaxID=4837 RepID=A0A162TZS5_PHYB8|nr:hypothetical protein PHYBLDRAFT_147671 [Phycomyces blakesleeanus NRRL 1555(-)]OAD71163.1 hypothetical protein PHYBLDRAFT_147671 [Phycomyces blakesleeanus NRRL 1555(-)]|eukprot:XP_018289203.1 hypothetical protein PHYBLDRAFT_147671 [Phycomyces blakesleeanus NRRL 1555(-)]